MGIFLFEKLFPEALCLLLTSVEFVDAGCLENTLLTSIERVTLHAALHLDILVEGALGSEGVSTRTDNLNVVKLRMNSFFHRKGVCRVSLDTRTPV